MYIFYLYVTKPVLAINYYYYYYYSQSSALATEYLFVPVALESTGVWGKKALELIKNIGRRITHLTGESRARIFLMQRISLEVQRGNARMVLADHTTLGGDVFEALL